MDTKDGYNNKHETTRVLNTNSHNVKCVDSILYTVSNRRLIMYYNYHYICNVLYLTMHVGLYRRKPVNIVRVNR